MHPSSVSGAMPSGSAQRITELRKLKNFENAYNGAFSIVAFVANRHLIDHMLRVGRILTDNDLEAILIWGVLAHQGVAHLMPPGLLPAAILNERGRLGDAEVLFKPLRLQDIAEITGIPRETARRKLAKLAEKRYVRKEALGWVVSTERLEPDLRDFTRDTVTRLLAVAEEIVTALRDADARAGAVS